MLDYRFNTPTWLYEQFNFKKQNLECLDMRQPKKKSPGIYDTLQNNVWLICLDTTTEPGKGDLILE